MILSQFRSLFTESITLFEDTRVVWKFPNGYGASLVRSATRTEVAVLYGVSICYDSPITSDIIPVFSFEEVEVILEKIQLLEGDK